MWAALGVMLPLAVAMAISSVPIMAVFALLLSPNRTRTALPFLIAWVVGMAVVVASLTLAATAIPIRKLTVRVDLPLAIALIAVGLALVVLGIIGARRGRGKSGMPGWLNAVGSMGAIKATGLALLLSIRPKAILLSAAVGLALRGYRLSFGETIVVLAVYTVISASTVVGPIVFSLVAPQRAGAWLLVARGWIEKNNAVITFLILLLVGVMVIGEGLSRI